MRASPDPPFWWKPWLRLPSLRQFWQREREVKPGSLSHGFGYLTLDPSPRLRRLRERLETQQRARSGPLPPLPESAYTAEGALLEPQTWPARFARGGIIPGGQDGSDRLPAWLDNGYIVPASMVQPVTFDDSDGEGELRPVKLVPVDEAEDEW